MSNHTFQGVDAKASEAEMEKVKKRRTFERASKIDGIDLTIDFSW
jgi:hypothetical protein